MYTLAKYTLPVRPSPSLCEKLQRELDKIDPAPLLEVDGCVARVVAPFVTSAVLAPFSRFIDEVKQQSWGSLYRR